MNNASKTVYYFGFYLLATGLTLIFVPNLLLTTFGFEPSTEVWVRVLGVVAFALGIYYVYMARTDSAAFNKITVYNRFLAAGCFILFAAIGLSQWQLVIFGGIDLLGALWTLSAIRMMK